MMMILSPNGMRLHLFHGKRPERKRTLMYRLGDFQLNRTNQSRSCAKRFYLVPDDCKVIQQFHLIKICKCFTIARG
jgi:hypothetical protein